MTTPAAMPLLSQGLPAYASNTSGYPAAQANNTYYQDVWRHNDGTDPSGGSPQWLAYDVSSLTSGQKTSVLLVWYNDPFTQAYYPAIYGNPPYSIPSNYTIDVNAAAGGGAAPGGGWVTLVTVTGNQRHSRQHAISLTGYNWVRINCTANFTTGGTPGIALNMDLHDVRNGLTDSWIFYGASINCYTMMHDNVAPGGTLSQLIQLLRPANFPVMENGGTPSMVSADGASYVPTWLADFPGKYVGLAFGTNDALASVSPATYKANYVTMINAVLAQGCIPIIPTIPYSLNATIQANAPALNAVIAGLYTTYPQIVPGPDLWTYFFNNQSIIDTDNVHPTLDGRGLLRWLWAGTLVKAIYSPVVNYGSVMAHA